ncbi:MAG TPA: nucleoside hydrolase [Gemmatimonadales bacterium]|nr:nucleoside hydrolase [Gemmatimonadales bacterium]
MGRRSSSGRFSRLVRDTFAVLLVLAALAALSFALPIRTWRTGELPAPPLPLTPGGPPVERPARVWIDTDAACGTGRTTDPDDCLALLLLARSPGIRVVGVSTVFGNAPLRVTDSVTRDLARQVRREGLRVYRGAAAPATWARSATDAQQALRQALRTGPLTIVALGPLTNVVAALKDAPELHRGVGRVVAVMGRRPGHLFHPAEGAGHGMLFGHGPVFRDFNFAQDPEGAGWLLESGLPVTLVPYDAARHVSLGAAELREIARSSPAGAWVARRAGEWLDYWREDVGRAGFYPFDLVGAAWVVDPSRFDCADVDGWVGPDRRLWGWLGSPEALMVGLPRERADGMSAIGRVRYCPGLRPGFTAWLTRSLTSAGASSADRGADAPRVSAPTE